MKFRALPDQPYLKECFDYDPHTGNLTWRARPLSHFFDGRSHRIWNTKHARQLAGCVSEGRTGITLGNIRYKAHRIIWKWMTGDDPAVITDHKNVIGTDNRWENLRSSDHSENRCNSAGRKAHKYPKGVSPFRKGFQAQIQVRGIRYHLGFHDTPEQAHEAYVIWARRLHGEFINTGD